MDTKAVNQAYERLERAASAIEDLANATEYWEKEAAWSNFLLAAYTIFSKLEQGAKKRPKSDGWFSQVKGERKRDPLLNYLKHARNADEHRLEEITGETPGLEAVISNGQIVHSRNFGKDIHRNYRTMGWSEQTGERELEYTPLCPPEIQLKPVVDKHSYVYTPPTEHLGAQIDDTSPLGIGRLALDYLTKLVTVAVAMRDDGAMR
jgi:hypothetical protein